MTCELLTKVLDARRGLANCDNASLSQPRGCPWQAVLDSARLARSRAPLTVSMDAHREHFTMAPFPWRDQRSMFDVDPERLAIRTKAGRVVEQRNDPRSSFTPFDLQTTACDPIQIARFGRNHFTQPFSVTHPGVGVDEIEPWQEADQTWRRLAVYFPPSNANHNPDQNFNN